MDSRHSRQDSVQSTTAEAEGATSGSVGTARTQADELLDSDAERSARSRLLEEVLASVELVLVADGSAFWREEPDHSLVLTASRSLSQDVLDTLDRYATTPLQSIMQRWPESPLVAVPLNDPANTIAEEIRQVTEREGIVGLAGVPCRIPGEMMGVLVVVHCRPHPWTVRDLGLATGLAGQLATAIQNARLYSSVRALVNRLAAIHELSLRLNRLRDVAAIGNAIVTEVGRLVDCDTVRVYRLDPEGVFRPVAASGTFVGIESPPLEALSTGHGETLPGWVAKRNEPLIIPDASVERRSIFRSTFGPESLLLVPMSYGDAVQGVLVVSKQGINKYGPDDEQALSIFGRYAAQAIVNANNIEELERQHAQLGQQVAAERRLLDLSEKLVSTLDPRRVLDQIAETIGTVVHYDRLTIYSYDVATAGIEPVLTRPIPGADEPVPTVQSLDEGLTSWAIGRGEPVCANDVGDEVLAAGPEGTDGLALEPTSIRRGDKDERVSQSIIVVPLRVHGEVVGSLNLTRVGGPEAHFSEHEFELSQLFAGQASIALQNAEAHVTVSSRADLDALTSLRNHGTFQRDLAEMVGTGKPFSLLMMDLDFFKTFNDTYGHPAGDTLLQTVAGAMVSATRQNDRAYRYGGDEFALLLFGASPAHAGEVSGRVRSAITESVGASAVGELGVHVSASVGAAHWPADGESAAALVEAADAALYRAKRQRPEGAGPGLGVGPSRAPQVAPTRWVNAGRELISASSVSGASAAMASLALALCSATDVFVALNDGVTLLPEPALVLVSAAVGVVAGAAPGRKPGMVQVAADGAFAAKPKPIRPGVGLWGRVWQSGKAEREQDEVVARTGAPLIVHGGVVGVIGISTPSVSGPVQDRSEELAFVADLGSATLERLLDRSAD
jgi:diguanylate cyclase (GGDEF)-like protein